MSKLRTAVIGVGSLGQHHARVYSQLPGVRLAGVFDSSPERAAEIAGTLLVLGLVAGIYLYFSFWLG